MSFADLQSQFPGSRLRRSERVMDDQRYGVLQELFLFKRCYADEKRFYDKAVTSQLILRKYWV